MSSIPAAVSRSVAVVLAALAFSLGLLLGLGLAPRALQPNCGLAAPGTMGPGNRATQQRQQLEPPSFVWAVSGQVKSGQMAKFMELLRPLAAAVERDEPGCLSYSFSRGVDQPDTFFMFERYANRSLLEGVHYKTQAFAAFKAALASAGIEYVRKERWALEQTDIGFLQRPAPAS